MLNCYCREHLIFFMLFVAQASLLVAVQAHQLSSGRFFFITQYFNFILVDNEVSHSVEITSWIRYLNFSTV